MNRSAVSLVTILFTTSLQGCNDHQPTASQPVTSQPAITGIVERLYTPEEQKYYSVYIQLNSPIPYNRDTRAAISLYNQGTDLKLVPNIQNNSLLGVRAIPQREHAFHCFYDEQIQQYLADPRGYLSQRADNPEKVLAKFSQLSQSND